MTGRSEWVDYAKAMGIVLVVYAHVARGVFNAGVEVPQTFYELTDSIIYSFHMPLFFFLSGLFFYGSFTKRGAKKLIASKIDTVVYPFLVWSILQGLTEAFLSRYTNGNVTYGEVFDLLWAPRAQFWFLYALFAVFVLSTFIYTTFSKRNAGMLMACSVLAYVYRSVLPDHFLVSFLANNVIFFALGIFLSDRTWIQVLSNRKWVVGLGVSFTISQVLFHQTLGLTFRDQGWELFFLASLSILFMVSVSVWLAKTPRSWLKLIGSSSMGIYLMHILAGSGARVILGKFLNVESFVVHLVVGTMIGIVVPMVALRLIYRFKIPGLFAASISRFFFRPQEGDAVPQAR